MVHRLQLTDKIPSKELNMPKTSVSLKESKNLYSSGRIVGMTDRIYEIDGQSVTFDEVIVKGDLSTELKYNGHKLRIVRIDTIVGLEVDQNGARGPLWKVVECKVIE
jgi:hypothetical protein